MSQHVTTPEVSNCWCGSEAKSYDWDYNFQYQVICTKGHTLTKQCGTRHRAICRWNNRVTEKL